MPNTPPKWREVYDRFRRGIEDGSYPVGTTLPGIPSLIVPGKLSDSTIKRAFAELIKEGLVRAEHGSGHWVIRSTPITPEQRLSKLEQEMAEVRRILNLGSPGDRP